MKVSTTTRLAAGLAAIALLSAGGLIALWYAAQPLQPLAASHASESDESEGAPSAPALPSLLINDDLLTPSGATPLESLPLNLPLYAPPHTAIEAKKLAAYERQDGEAGEQVAIYSFNDADLQHIQAFYNDHAHRLGFTPEPDASPDSGGKLYSRDDQVLLIRVRQAGPAVRLTILLRYTESR